VLAVTVASRLAAMVGKLPPAHTHAVSVERDLAVPMADGAALLTDRWYPNSPGVNGLPIILVRSPYGRRQLGIVGRIFAERGYQVVIQSCRGTFGSGGRWEPFRNERADGRTTLDWLTAQPWFSGAVGTWGGSYLGLTQWAVAAGAPEFVKAMSLSITASDFRDSVTYPGGSFALETTLSWVYQLEHQELGFLRVLRAQVRGNKELRSAFMTLPLADADRSAIDRHAEFFQHWLVHDATGDSWWEPTDFSQAMAEVPPASLVAGWYDIFLPAQVADFEALRDARRGPRLTIGPWSHTSLAGGAAALRDALEWFDCHLRGDASRLRARPVRIYVMGARRWADVADWPPPAKVQRWYLHRGGALSPSEPDDSGPDRYRYDPADPTPGVGGSSLSWKNNGPKDNRELEGRPDVLTYTSVALADALTVAGPVAAELHLRSSLEHTDFFVRLCDVAPNGRSTNLSDGIRRLCPGEIDKQPDGSFALTIAMWPTANEFRRGHRLRLQVSSGAHPVYARNPGSNEPLGSATTLLVANQEVFHDPQRPSALELPIASL
jgi:putative CocE/NonD family hydrolase